uniref:Uncharacterized protein n=1 Tax=Trichogramma kaykai TaxID=54128 RepID=A0ABD2VRI8_9HYME
MEIEEIRSIDDTDKVHDQHIIREPCNSVKVSSDPVLWVINNATIDHIMTNGFTKNMNRDFKKSKCEYATGPRYFLKADFETTLPNGENVYRKWLICSESTGKVFCGPCVLFDRKAQFGLHKQGFDD